MPPRTEIPTQAKGAERIIIVGKAGGVIAQGDKISQFPKQTEVLKTKKGREIVLGEFDLPQVSSLTIKDRSQRVVRGANDKAFSKDWTCTSPAVCQHSH